MKELYSLYAEDLGMPELVSEISKVKSRNQLDKFAGQLQSKIATDNPNVASSYGFNAPVTQQGINWLNKNKGKSFNTNIGYYGQNAKAKAELDNYIKSLSDQEKQDYGKANFLDNRAYFRMPLFEEQRFDLDNPDQNKAYQNYLQTTENTSLKNNSYFYPQQDNINVFSRPVTLQRESFKTREDLNTFKSKYPQTEEEKVVIDNRSNSPVKKLKIPSLEGLQPEEILPINPIAEKPFNLEVTEPKLVAEPLTLTDPLKEEEKVDQPKPETTPPGELFDVTPEAIANTVGLLGSLWTNTPRRSSIKQFKLPVNHLTRPVDQPAMQNSMMNNVFASTAFQNSQRNLPAYLQQAFLNNATGKMYDKLPLANITNYYQNFSNQQVQDTDNFLNRVYNAENAIFQDNRKQVDNILHGYEKARSQQFMDIYKYLANNAKLQTETPWKFMQYGMKPKQVGPYKWRYDYDTSTADLQMANSKGTGYNQGADRMTDDELMKEFKRRNLKP